MLKKTITPIEKKVMMSIWCTDHPMALAELVQTVNNRYGTDWKPQTISTYLAKLVVKKYLRFERAGRVFLYYPEVTQEEFTIHELKDFFEYYDTFNGEDFLNALQESGKLTPEDLAEIKQFLDSSEK
ncbi:MULTISPECIES: BlaI/MecI/CopY family transcriptional regulator [Clostridia]|uniref:BlaI/MecI/CopY family transcriptional regulator n=1 Tax=Clostridia TaxID=186801 RepID=UPI000E529C31|nr:MULTISPECIES: BlaI/MecI/CopY family transcriptional regulator [Clostridia]RHV70270.1 hypothetical protein DXB15_08190 [Roseburia sp. OM02-15]